MPVDIATGLSAPPSEFYVPDGSVFTLADEIADLMVDLGYEVAEPERLVCHALYAQKPNGLWAGVESGVVTARQNVKTTAMLSGAIHDLWVQDVPKVNWTAHEFKTSTETFGEFKRLVDTYPWLSRRVKQIRESNGKEGIDLHSGAKLNILARTKRSGRGMGAGRLYGDEALFWTDMQLGAIVPTMSAQRNAHLVHGSSPGLLTSAPLRRLRDRGRSGVDPYLGWVEWGTERRPCLRADCTHQVGSVGCQLDNEDNWWMGNPALDRRISRDYVRQERLTLPVAEFMRERMGWWEDPPPVDESGPFDMGKWAERFDASSRIPDGTRVVFAADTSWDRQTSWVSIAGLNAAGVPHGEVIETGYGQDWVVPWLKERVAVWKTAGIGLQGGNAPSSSLLAPLRKEFGDKLVVEFTGVDMTRACGAFFDAVDKGPLAHPDQEQVDDAMRQAAPRLLGDGWVLDRKESPIDIANLVSLVEALYLLQTAPEPPQESFIPRRLR